MNRWSKKIGKPLQEKGAFSPEFQGRRGTFRLFPSRSHAKQGSALVISLWTIALLSLLVMSFAFDALLEGKINMYVRERRRVDYMTQSGIAIAEMLLLDYKNASGSSTTEQDTDKWLRPKLDLQRGGCNTTVHFWKQEESVTFAPDGMPQEGEEEEVKEEDKGIELGSVKVEITSAEAKHWPINLLVSSDVSDQIWENILNVIGLPMEYQEEVVDSWYDWRDEDSTKTGSNGGEEEYYDTLDPPYKPRNGEIATVDELKMIKGIRDRPAIFDGGLLVSEEEKELEKENNRSKGTSRTSSSRSSSKKSKEDEVIIKYGLKAFFDIYGENVKININSASKEVLMTVPGIDGDEEIANAIIEERTTGANMTTSGNEDDVESTFFKDWNDVNTRLFEALETTCESYFSYAPEKYFEVKITGESAGITHTILAVAVVQNDEIRYVKWREDP